MCWSVGSIFFTRAGRLVGSPVVNRTRLPVALVLLLITHFFVFGTSLPVFSNWQILFWFGISGIIGYVIGDSFLFESFVLVGPRLAMLMMSLVPIFSTIIGWLFLDEILKPLEIFAIFITVLGIAWVIMERGDIEDKNGKNRKNITYIKGILFGIGGALCQSLGLIFSKKGLSFEISPLTGNLIRVFSGTVIIWIIAILRGRVRHTAEKLKNKKAFGGIFIGALMGPFLGVWLSLIAVQNTYVGIASTLMSLAPVILIPLSHWIFKEKITVRAILGTLLAVSGVTLIFLY